MLMSHPSAPSAPSSPRPFTPIPRAAFWECWKGSRPQHPGAGRSQAVSPNPALTPWGPTPLPVPSHGIGDLGFGDWGVVDSGWGFTGDPQALPCATAIGVPRGWLLCGIPDIPAESSGTSDAGPAPRWAPASALPSRPTITVLPAHAGTAGRRCASGKGLRAGFGVRVLRGHFLCSRWELFPAALRRPHPTSAPLPAPCALPGEEVGGRWDTPSQG